MSEYINHAGAGSPAPVNRSGMGVPGLQSPVGKKKKFSFKSADRFRLFTGLLLVCVTILLVALLVYLFVFGGGKADLSQVKSNQYQAVFLNSSDGQVYFGRLSQLNKDYYKLTDIYYVRVTTVQPDKNTTTQAQQNISLAKLGNEIHGPEDAMYIAKQDVMFWENLKEDGQVVKAIREYQKTGGASATTTPTPTTATTPTPTP